MSVPVLTMMVGLPGSGKSYLAKELAKETENTVVLASDDIREELFGDVNDMTKHKEVFTELHRRAYDALRAGQSVIYDATNLNSKRRMSFLKTIDSAGIQCTKNCYLMAFSYCDCLENNVARERVVPAKVINKMREKFQPPYYFEGWDNIEIVRGTMAWKLPDVEMLYLMDYYEYNEHHTETLGDHLQTTCFEVAKKTKDSNVRTAAILHDIGKPFVRTMTDARGNPSDDAHYYGHENVGAYEALFYKCDDPLYVSVLVNLHMRPFTLKTEKVREKYRKLWGEKLYNDVMLIHEADVKRRTR